MLFRGGTRRTRRRIASHIPGGGQARLRQDLRRTRFQLRNMEQIASTRPVDPVQSENVSAPTLRRNRGTLAEERLLTRCMPVNRLVLRPARMRIATMSYSPVAFALGTMINCGCCGLSPEIRKVGNFLAVSVTSDASRTPIPVRRSRRGIRSGCGTPRPYMLDLPSANSD